MRLYYQQGQSFVLTMIFLLILSLSMVFVFNITMMLDERLTAKSLADHAAYSTANQQAKLLNFMVAWDGVEPPTRGFSVRRGDCERFHLVGKSLFLLGFCSFGCERSGLF